MPYKIVPKSNGKFMVKNKDSGKIKAYNTTKAKANAQVSYLEMINHKNDGNLVGRKKFMNV